MKKIISIALLALFTLPVLANDVMDKGKKKRNRVAAKGQAALAAFVEEQPAGNSSYVTPVSKEMTVKVFDVKGQLVLEKKMLLERFLNRGYANELPQNSTFVMFYNNTAYYFQES